MPAGQVLFFKTGETALNKKMGYSIRYQGDQMIAVGVSRLEKARWRIENLEQNSAEAGPSDSLAKAIIKSKNTFTMMAEGEEVNSALISLPKLKKKQMKLAVNGWVAREESTPADQWSVVWNERQRTEETTEENKAQVFLLYATKKFIATEMARPKSWEGVPSRLMPDFLVLEAMYRNYGPGREDLEGWNIVFVSKDDHFLCVSTPSGLIMNRPLPADLSDGADDEEYYGRLATEVDRSIFFARQTEYNPNVQRIIVCGEPTLAQGLVAQLKEETSVPAVYWNISEMFENDGQPLAVNVMLPAMAAIMARRKCRCNLLPDQPKILIGPIFQKRIILAAVTAAAVIIPLLAVGGYITSNIQDRYLERAHQNLSQAQVRAEKAAEVYVAQRVLQAKEEHISTVGENDQDYAQVLLHLAALTPGEIVFKDLRLKQTSQGQLVLMLTGESIAKTVEVAQQSFLNFQTSLNESPLLLPTGEPRKLQIAAEKNQGVEVKKVEFIMEYQVKSDFEIQDNVALVVANIED